MQRQSAALQLVHQIQFRSLRSAGSVLAFPCDARGRVELDALSESARVDYLFARAMVGREMALPTIVAVNAKAYVHAGPEMACAEMAL